MGVGGQTLAQGSLGGTVLPGGALDAVREFDGARVEEGPLRERR